MTPLQPEEGVSEVGEFLTENSMDKEHTYRVEDVLRLSPGATFTLASCEDTDCRTRHTHYVVEVLKDDDNVGLSDKHEVVDVRKDNDD